LTRQKRVSTPAPFNGCHQAGIASASSWADRLWLDRLRLAQLTQARSLPGLVSPLRFDDLPRDLTRGRGLVSCRDFFGLEKCLLRHGHDNLLSVWRSDASKKSGWIKAVRARSKNKKAGR
jgi:hypothetical protein